MKMPKWLVTLLLSVSIVSVLTAGGWWWVTWPDQTMREFVALAAAGNLQEARAMAECEPEVVFDVEHLAACCGAQIGFNKTRRRTAVEIILGTKWFFDSDPSRGVWKSYLPGEEEKDDPNTRLAIYVKSVRAQRGKIVFGVDGPL